MTSAEPTSGARMSMRTALAMIMARPMPMLAIALRKIGGAGVRQLPALEGGLLVGMLYERDVARWLQLRSQLVREPRRPRVRHA